MHYSSKAFSRNGGVTIQPKQRGVCFVLRYKITKLVGALWLADTREELGEFSTVMQTLDFVSDLP